MKPDFEEYDEVTGGRLPRIKNMSDPHKPQREKAVKHLPKVETPILAESEDTLETLPFTYKPSRHERQWIIDSLSQLYDQHWFQDILRMVKGGKEASVYLCQTDGQVTPGLIAAKIYRPRRFRSLKNDHIYREGRANLDANGNIIKNSGMLHAIQKKTAYGIELTHSSWIEHEFHTLQILHKAGADIPQPFVVDNNAILMGYIGDIDVAAPALNDVNLKRSEAKRLFERVIANIDLMLAHNRIHADLSAFNILYWNDQITLIDFPQAIHPDENRNAYRIFERDVTRVCEYFARQGVKSNPHHLATELWTKHQRLVEAIIDPHLLDDQSEADVVYWRGLSER